MPAAVEYIWKSDQTRVGTDMRYPDRPKNGGQDVGGVNEVWEARVGCVVEEEVVVDRRCEEVWKGRADGVADSGG